MALTVNEILRDAAIDHQVDMAQYSNHEARRILALLNKANTSLAAKLTDAVDRLGAESFTAQVIDAKLKSIRELLAAQYKAMGETLMADLGDVVDAELEFQRALYGNTIPPVALAAVPIVKVAPGQVRAIAFSRPFQGRLLKEWMAGLEATTASRIRDAIRMGMVEGQTTPEIIRRIMGTKAEGYADGLMEISRRDAEAVVRTAISHVNGVARDSFFAANEDILESVVWSSTLDGRTSSGCRLRDGLRYTATDHKPIGHTIPWLAGPGRLHWRCRSGSYAITKLWSELGIEPDLGTRASMDGQVPAETTYGDWLRKQSPERQDQVLGPARGALFRSGNLKLPDFYDAKGKYLTLEQLRERSPAVFGMTALTGAGSAEFDIRKLTGYALNPDNPRGKDKAFVFASVLGFDLSNADLLRSRILEALPNSPAKEGITDKHGRRFSVDIQMTGPRGSATVRTAWIYDVGSDIPRLSSVYVLKRK